MDLRGVDERGGFGAPVYVSAGSAEIRARSQFFRGVKPIFLRRSVGTAAGLPTFISQGCDSSMAERDEAIPSACLSMPMMLRRVLEGLPRILVPSRVFPASLVLGNSVCVGGAVVQFSGSLVVFAMVLAVVLAVIFEM
jgi:hypothetical protein